MGRGHPLGQPNSSYLFVKDTNNLNIETRPWPWHQPLENIMFDKYQSRSKHQTTTHEFKLSTCWAFWKERPPGRVSACRCTVGTWEQLLLLYLNTPLETPTHPSKSFNINTSPSSIHFTTFLRNKIFTRVPQLRHESKKTQPLRNSTCFLGIPRHVVLAMRCAKRPKRIIAQISDASSEHGQCSDWRMPHGPHGVVSEI